MNLPASTDRRNLKIDLIKVIATFFVLLWHTSPLPKDLPGISGILIKLFYFNITLTAVPLFLICSLSLTWLKFHQVDPQKYALKRISKLVKLFVFWSLIQVSIYLILRLTQVVLPSFAPNWKGDKFNLYRWIMGIEPPLPFVGDSVFYFLMILIQLTIVLFVLKYLLAKIQSKNTLLLYLSLCSIFMLFSSVLFLEPLKYYDLKNFLIYIPMVILMTRITSHLEKVSTMMIISMAWLASIIYDLLSTDFYQQTFNLYGRFSITLGALTIFNYFNLSDFQINRFLVFKQANKLINFLAPISLGIYATHKYWQMFFISAFSRMSNIIPLLNLGFFMPIIIFVLVTIFSCISSHYLSKTKFKYLVK